jgi:hypothetical protein
LLVRVSNDTGFKSRAERLIESLGGRWTNRESGYVMSSAAVAKLEKLHAAGFDADIRYFADSPIAFSHRGRRLNDLSAAEALRLADQDPGGPAIALEEPTAELSSPSLARFADPDGEAAKAQTESLEHDVRMDAAEETSGAADQQTYRLSEEGPEQTLEQILAEIDADEAAVDALRGCLK